MLKQLNGTFSKLQEAGYKLKARKRQLFANMVEFLGHVVQVQTQRKLNPKLASTNKRGRREIFSGVLQLFFAIHFLIL